MQGLFAVITCGNTLNTSSFIKLLLLQTVSNILKRLTENVHKLATNTELCQHWTSN